MLWVFFAVSIAVGCLVMGGDVLPSRGAWRCKGRCLATRSSIAPASFPFVVSSTCWSVVRWSLGLSISEALDGRERRIAAYGLRPHSTKSDCSVGASRWVLFRAMDEHML